MPVSAIINVKYVYAEYNNHISAVCVRASRHLLKTHKTAFFHRMHSLEGIKACKCVL